MGAVTGAPSNAVVNRAGKSSAAATQSGKAAEREQVGNYDSRTSSPKALARASAEVLRDNGKAITALGKRLGSQAVVSLDPLTGTPHNVARLDGFLTGPSAKSPVDVALGYVRANFAALGLSEADLQGFDKPTVKTDTNGIRHISWTQSLNGVKVFGNGLRAHVAKDGSLISLQGSPVAGLQALAAAAPEASLTAANARQGAAADVRGKAVPTSSRTTGGTTIWSNGDRAHLVYFVTAAGLRTGWSTYTQPGPSMAYQHVVDAVNGKTLYRRSTIHHDRGDALVFKQYPGAPRGGEQAQVNLFRRGFLARNATWLNGRYAIAWSDVNDDNEVQQSEKTAVPGTANRAQFRLVEFPNATSQCGPHYRCTWDPDEAFSWRANRRQDATQGFVLTSSFHDYLRDSVIGFTAEMGNFERSGGDPVLLHVLDGANSTGDGFPDGNHIDNANMNTPPDGIPPTMQMYLNHFPGTTPAEDPYLPASASDAADNIYHEYVHGLSNRLVVDAGGNSTLTSLHAGAMGEGWSDFYAMDLIVHRGFMNDTARSGEILFDRYLTKNRPITRSEAIDCARNASGRLCTKADGTDGGYTFGDLGNATGGPQVHADSMIWSQTLWDLRTKLGHKVTANIVTEAMSLSPNDPSFLDMRDAILLADRAIYSGDNSGVIWGVFANRGMGWFASASDGSDAQVVEDFHRPPPPHTPRRTAFGFVYDDATEEPLAGAVVKIPGHSSGVSNYSDVTDADGYYQIDNILAGRYPELVAQAPAYDVLSKVLNVRNDDRRVDFPLRRDWAADVGGASLVDFTGPNYGPGCGPFDAIDLNFGEGWSSDRGNGEPVDVPVPKYIVVQLPQPITVSEFGVDPSNTCGDAGSASTGPFRIEVSTDGENFTQVAEGTFTPEDRGRLNTVAVDAPLPGVEYVKFWIDDSQVEQLRDPADLCSEGAAFDGCTYMDLTELEVYGAPGGAVTKDVQILSFNDYHGHLEATDTPQPPLPAACTAPNTPPGCTPPVGGVEYLAAHVKALRAEQPDSTLTVAAGDLIGGSAFISGIFQDEPSVASMNELGLDVSSVGNHEFDEGLTELRRMIEGGCHPQGCFQDGNGDDIPYAGTDFEYLGANVVEKATGENLPWLPGTSVKTVDGVDVGFIGMTLEATDALVNPAGVSAVNFEDEVVTANAQAAALKAQGVEAIVVLLHEGGNQTGTFNQCVGISDPINTIAQELDAEIDLLVTGHTHQPYVCSIDDPAGNPRLVTSAASWGQVLTETPPQD